MNAVWVILALPAGAALGWAQLRLLARLMEKPNMVLFLLKLPLWALPMLAAAYLSLWALLGLAMGAGGLYIGYAVRQGARLREGGRQKDGD